MEFVSKLKKLSIVAAVLAAVMGIVFIIFPQQCITFAALAVGIALIILGVSGVINYFRKEVGTFILSLSIIVTITGIVVCVQYRAIISLIVVILGVFMMTTGIFNLITSFKFIAAKPVSGWFTVLLSVLNVIFGIIAMFNSSALTVSIVRFIGVALLFYCILGVVSYLQVRDLVKKVSKPSDDMNEELPNGDIRTNGKEVK